MARTKSLIKRLIKLGISLAVRWIDVAKAGLCRIGGRPQTTRCVVLYYHAVPVGQRGMFAKQMDHLLRVARPLPADHQGGLGSSGSHAVVTFDDGFVSVLQNALPELKKRNIPFTMFIPSGCLGQRPPWIRNPSHPSWHERVVSATELSALAEDPLVTVGSHSVSHPNFLRLKAEAASREMTDSKTDLEKVWGRPVQLFSFPFGAHNPALHELASRTGYRRVFTSNPELAFQCGEEFRTGRVAVDPDDWWLEFKLKAAGAYRWLAFRRGEG